MKDCVYDTTGEKAYYREYIEEKNRRDMLFGGIASFMVIFGGLIPIIFLGVERSRDILPLTLLAIFGGLFALSLFISSFRSKRRIVRTEKVGVRVDNTALEFIGIGAKRFDLSEIDSVIVGEDFGCWGCRGRRIAVKTLSPSSDGRGSETYYWDIRFVIDAEKFADCLVCNGVDVFYKNDGHYSMHTKEEVKGPCSSGEEPEQED